MKMLRKDEGFTLIELMVVVLIIGILVAIAIPVFNSAKNNAQKRSCFANERTLEGAAHSYEASTGALPTNGWANLITALNPGTSSTSYVATTPVCPAAPIGTNYYDWNNTTAQVTCSLNGGPHGHF